MSFTNRFRLKTSVLVTHVNTATDKGSDDILLHGQKWTRHHEMICRQTKTWGQGCCCSLSLCAAAAKKCVYTSDVPAVVPTFFGLHRLLSVIVRKTQQWASTDKHKYMCVCVCIFLTFINFGSCFQSWVMCSESTSSSSEMTLISLLQPNLFHGWLWKSKKTCLIRLCSMVVLVLQFLLHS